MALRPRVVGGDVRGPERRPMGAASETKDTFISAIVKWIPVEVIGVYEAVVGAFGHEARLLPHFIISGTIVTALWIAFATGTRAIAWRQVILASLAFLFWTIGTEDPSRISEHFSWWNAKVSLASLALGTLALPIFDGILSKLGVPQD